MEFAKGKLEIVKISVSTYQIWAKPKPNRKALLVASNLNEDDAKELVRRWNAFEDGGLVDELRTACKELLENEPYGITPYFDEALRKIEAALAKS